MFASVPVATNVLSGANSSSCMSVRKVVMCVTTVQHQHKGNRAQLQRTSMATGNESQRCGSTGTTLGMCVTTVQHQHGAQLQRTSTATGNHIIELLHSPTNTEQL